MTNGSGKSTLSRMQQQLLRIVASGQPIASMGDSFFVTLQREPFPLARSREEQVQRWNETREFGQHIVRTEISSRNLSTLMIRLTTLLETLATNNEPLDQFRGSVDLELPNLTRVVTIFTLHLIAAPHRDLVRYFPDSDMLTRLFCAICTTIAKLPISHDTVCFYEDLLELLLCLLSEQLTDRFDDPFPRSPDEHHLLPSPPYLCSIFTCACSQELIFCCLTRLLSNIDQGTPPPPPPPTSAYPSATPLTAVAVPLSASGSAPSGGLFGAITGLFASRPPADLTRIAELSSYILGLIASQRELMQSWTMALLGVQDSVRSGSALNLVAVGSKLTFPFKKLLGVLQDRIAIPQYAVLLYALVYKNDGFLEYVLAQMDPDRLIVPILRFIFVACFSTYTPSNAPPIPPIPPASSGPSSSPISPRPPPTPHSAYETHPPPPHSLAHPTHSSGSTPATQVPYSHIYILAITLLILTSDTSYLETLMTVTCPSGVPEWLNDRRAFLSPSMSLGSLMALVVMRVMQANLAADRDQYLHANCVAILANLSRSWRGMHAVVALRLVNWVEVVARRYARLKVMASRKGKGGAEVGSGTGGAESDAGSAPQTPRTGASQAEGFVPTSRRGSMIEHAVLDPSTDLAIYAELVAFLLDIIKSVLHPTQLRFNPHLVHALLHKQALLAPLADEDTCSATAETIHSTLEYFRQRITGEGGDVLSQIADLSKAFQLSDTTLPNVRFEYAEDVDTSAFFIPFAWRAIYLASPYLAWDPMQPGVFEDEEPLGPQDDSIGLGLHATSSMSLSWMGSGSLSASSRSLASSAVALQSSGCP